MSRRRLFLALLPAALILLLIFLLRETAIWPGTDATVVETFDAPGEWDSGDDASALAGVTNGRYEIMVRAASGIYRGSAPQRYADGIYEVTATQLDGPLDNGYGLVIRLDPEDGLFYMFEISGDGFIWLGMCEKQCDNQGWQVSEMVNQGHNVANHLQVVADGPEMRFFVNGREVGSLVDKRLRRGQVAFLVETFGAGGVHVAFDDFKVRPLSE